MLALAVFACAVCIAHFEARRSAYRDKAERRQAFRTSVALGAAAALIEALVSHASFEIRYSAGFAASFVAVCILDDFFFYICHRLSHRVAFFWATHSVHHSPARFNFFASLRQPPTWPLTPAAVAPIMLYMAGIPLTLLAGSGILRAVYNFVLHTERVRRLPAWVEYVFNTPSHHRVHHSAQAEMIDTNFGAVLIVWDRLFGTFAKEPCSGVTRYGVLHPAPEESARAVFLHPWRRLFRRAAAVRSLAGKASVFLKPPA